MLHTHIKVLSHNMLTYINIYLYTCYPEPARSNLSVTTVRNLNKLKVKMSKVTKRSSQCRPKITTQLQVEGGQGHIRPSRGPGDGSMKSDLTKFKINKVIHMRQHYENLPIMTTFYNPVSIYKSSNSLTCM